VMSDPIADMTTCEPCALREAGDTARAEAIESIRSQRLVLAFLNGAEDAQGRIVSELGGCLACVWRLAATYLGNYAQALAHMAGDGGAEAAAQWIERGLMEDLDGQQG
jgi:hypothetical protein